LSIATERLILGIITRRHSQASETMHIITARSSIGVAGMSLASVDANDKDAHG